MPGPSLSAKPLESRLLALRYLDAKERVIDAGFAGEIDWQDGISVAALSERTFLKESAWVVLSSGFRASVVQRCFESLSEAFLNWTSAEEIISNAAFCRQKALAAFRNTRKIDGIFGIVQRVAAEGIDVIKENIRAYGTDYLREFPFMGPITAIHLAKNLGVQIVKPDRHLVRLAKSAGYESVDVMCRAIADHVGDSLSVIDIVLWRYATITNGCRSLFPRHDEHLV